MKKTYYNFGIKYMCMRRELCVSLVLCVLCVLATSDYNYNVSFIHIYEFIILTFSDNFCFSLFILLYNFRYGKKTGDKLKYLVSTVFNRFTSSDMNFEAKIIAEIFFFTKMRRNVSESQCNCKESSTVKTNISSWNYKMQKK